MCVYVGAVGLKGEVFLNGLLRRGVPVTRVFTYPQENDQSNGFEGITALCRSRSIPIVEERRPTAADIRDANLVFLVGWQYLLPLVDPRLVVFHDSLLPRYRGFLPTVTSLIAGDDLIGVTAFPERN